MSRYFIKIDDRQYGPLSIKELKNHKITRETPVWKDGSVSWLKAGEFRELEKLFDDEPQPMFTQNPTQPGQVMQTKKKGITLIALIAGIFIAGLALAMFMMMSGKG